MCALLVILENANSYIAHLSDSAYPVSCVCVCVCVSFVPHFGRGVCFLRMMLSVEVVRGCSAVPLPGVWSSGAGRVLRALPTCLCWIPSALNLCGELNLVKGHLPVNQGCWRLKPECWKKESSDISTAFQPRILLSLSCVSKHWLTFKKKENYNKREILFLPRSFSLSSHYSFVYGWEDWRRFLVCTTVDSMTGSR